MKNNKPIGFTLIEIIVVIFIIGLIVSIANISISKIREKGKDIERIDNIKQVQLALEMYRRDVGSYPDSLTFGEQLVSPINSNIVYLQKIPQNPSYRNNENCSNEEYTYSMENNSYLLGFCLESPTESYALGYNCANNEGIKSERCFQCGMPIAYEGQNYNTVTIGEQCWFQENLNIGTMVNGNVDQTDNYIIEKYCYSNNPNKCDGYGGLYQWNEAMQYLLEENSQGICPSDWHIPSNTEWTNLINYLGGELVAGNKMKAPSSTTPILWNGNNSSGFTALPAGYRHMLLTDFIKISGSTYFWSSSEYSSNNSWNYFIMTDPEINSNDIQKNSGLSVRCLKNN